MVLISQMRYDEALVLLEEVSNVLSVSHGKDHPTVRVTNIIIEDLHVMNYV